MSWRPSTGDSRGLCHSPQSSVHIHTQPRSRSQPRAGHRAHIGQGPSLAVPTRPSQQHSTTCRVVLSVEPPTAPAFSPPLRQGDSQTAAAPDDWGRRSGLQGWLLPHNLVVLAPTHGIPCRDWAAGYSNCTEEPQGYWLPVEGCLPAELEGTFLR